MFEFKFQPYAGPTGVRDSGPRRAVGGAAQATIGTSGCPKPVAPPLLAIWPAARGTAG